MCRKIGSGDSDVLEILDEWLWQSSQKRSGFEYSVAFKATDNPGWCVYVGPGAFRVPLAELEGRVVGQPVQIAMDKGGGVSLFSARSSDCIRGFLSIISTSGKFNASKDSDEIFQKLINSQVESVEVENRQLKHLIRFAIQDEKELKRLKKVFNVHL